MAAVWHVLSVKTSQGDYISRVNRCTRHSKTHMNHVDEIQAPQELEHLSLALLTNILIIMLPGVAWTEDQDRAVSAHRRVAECLQGSGDGT